MKTLFRYPGGKSRMLPVLRPYLRKLVEGETHYAEPFVGGGSVALEVARCNPKIKLFLNDKDNLVASVWRVICGRSRDVEALCRKLDVRPTVPLYQEIKATEFKDTIGKAFKGLFLNRCSFNGMIHNSSPMGGVQQNGKCTLDSEYKPAVLAQLLHEYHNLLKGRTTVSCDDAINFIRRHKDCSMFVDPPYFPNGGSNKLYGVYMTREEHERLASRLAGLRKCVVTYDYCETVRAMFVGAGFSTSATTGFYSSGKAKHGFVIDDGSGPSEKKWKVKVELIATKGIQRRGCVITPLGAGHRPPPVETGTVVLEG
jgi:DNA adenine methylase